VGLPPSGSTFNSVSQPTHHYQLGVYSTNDAILIDTNHLVSNITPASPAPAYGYAFLTAGGNIGGTPMQNLCVLQHQDGVNETNTFYGYDWFYSGAPGAIAYKANGRVNMSSRTLNNISNSTPYLFETYFTLTDPTSPVTNIVVKYETAPGVASTTFIMAVSASSAGIPPVVTQGPLPVSQTWYPAQTATFSVQTSGTAPITNSWLVEKNGVFVPLANGVSADGSTVSGANSATLSISGLTVGENTSYEYVGANAFGSTTSSPAPLYINGYAGVVPIIGWNNIANANYPLGSSTNIYASNGVTSASLTLSDTGANNAWSSGLTGNGANFSLMDGYIDAGANGGEDAVATISGLTDSSYDVYIYCMSDNTQPATATNGLPNYTVNGVIYYAPVLGNSGASTYNLTSKSVGGTGFNGFIPATTISTNDLNADLPASSFGNYIKIANVQASGGQITVQAEADYTSFRSPLNAIELVSTSNDGQDFGINFLGNTTDKVNGKATVPIIDSQSPATSFSVLAGHNEIITYSVTIDASSPTPLSYQWFLGSTPIPNATNATFLNGDTNTQPISCVITNFVGSVTSAPISLTIISKPTFSAYETAVFAYNPVAYWPLNETAGNVAFDYASTNDGTYMGTYTLGQTGPSTPGIGTNNAVTFDGSSGYVDIPTNNLNITGPVTVIAWVQATNAHNFMTAIGHSDSSYRVSVVNGSPRFADAGPDVTTSVMTDDGNWHQLVGVYDGTTQYLYVDGHLAGSATGSAPAGSTDHVTIGAAPDYLGGRNFEGNLAQIAIIPSALSAAQVLSLFDVLGTAPVINSIAPATPTVYVGESITLNASLSGSLATKLQWYYIDNNSISNNIAGATNLSYTISNATVAQNGYTYGINVSNPYGSTTASVPLSVLDAPAGAISDLSPATAEAYAGAPVTYSIDAIGSLPIYYQWTLDGATVTGATNRSFTFAASCGSHTIQVTYSNLLSAGNPVTSAQVALQVDSYPTNITFNTNGTGWLLNAGPKNPGTLPAITTNQLELTDNGGSEASSAFYTIPQYVGDFTASFTYTGNGGADGTAFILQNYSQGATSLGGGGGALGYGPINNNEGAITNSIALEFNLYSPAGVGMGVGTNGSTGIYGLTGPVNIGLGDPINVVVNFANGNMAVSLTDASTKVTFSTNYVFGSLLPSLGGNLAYIGFAGGDGGSTSVQTISNFQFHSIITPASLSVSPVTNNAVVISWPATSPSYSLETSPSLTNPAWVPGPSATVSGNTASVTVKVNGTSQAFFRLLRSTCN
jgi:hypothetical protein